MAELGRVFGTTESNRLEQLIDGKEVRRNAQGEAQWSRKYDRYLQGTVPGPSTIARAEAAARRSGESIRLHYWLEHPLWRLLAEPALPLDAVRSILADLPRVIRRQLYHLELPDRYGRCLRQDFERNQVISLRDRGSLDAFVALLALAREGEILEEDPKHSLSARCAFEIFPLMVLDHPHLAERWVDLFLAVQMAFWAREYHGGFRFNDYTLCNAAYGIGALSHDRTARLPWTAGHARTLAPSELADQ